MSMIILSIQTNLYLVYALLLLIGGSLGVAVADVTIDACVTENSIRHPSLAGDMQSLCGFSSSIGQVIGFTISGFLVHIIGSKTMTTAYRKLCLTRIQWQLLQEDTDRFNQLSLEPGVHLHHRQAAVVHSEDLPALAAQSRLRFFVRDTERSTQIEVSFLFGTLERSTQGH